MKIIFEVFYINISKLLKTINLIFFQVKYIFKNDLLIGVTNTLYHQTLSIQMSDY
jgi:hypothetical protein